MEDGNEVYDFGLRLKEQRLKKNWSQAEMARKLDMHKESIHRYENNLQKPSLERLIQIAALLNCSIDYLLGFEKVPSYQFRNLSEEKQNALEIFIRAFIDDSTN